MKYPTAVSLLLPVVKTIQPNLLDSAISVVPRTRLCRFSSVKSADRFSKLGSSISKYELNAGSIEIVCISTPSDAAKTCASVREPADEYRDGIETP